MRLLLLIGLLIGLKPLFAFSQPADDFTSACSLVYSEHPDLPRGILEAVSFTQTRFSHLDETVQPSCIGLPAAFGYLGLIEDGQNYFRNNLSFISANSGISVSQIKSDPVFELRAWALAYLHISQQKVQTEGLTPGSAKLLYETLKELSFIPKNGMVNDFALNSETYEILRFLNDTEKQNQFAFPKYKLNLQLLFGENYDLLSSSRISIATTISTDSGKTYKQSSEKSTEYGPAVWNPAATCNFSSRSGTAISAITIHTIQGTYAGAISWSQNCNSSVSYHYVIRSSDGQVTQMVEEAYKAWHVGSENPYTIGYEHEGYVTQPQWYTEAMYQASAALSRDIVNSGYGIPALRTYYGASSSGSQVLGNCTKIKGHQHFANQSHTDPGINWNWEKYYRLINNNPLINPLTSLNGSFTDTGGATGNYTDNQRVIWTIQPSGASGLTLNFSQFSIENNYDKLFIYDGSSIDANLIGVYTGTVSPGTITASGNALTVEFRSDCGTVAAGWVANWTGTLSDSEPPVSFPNEDESYKTEDFLVTFQDNDAGLGVAKMFVCVADREDQTADWHANPDFGFLHEHFEAADLWQEISGDWSLENGTYVMNDASQANSNASILIAQDSLTRFLYHWKQTFTDNGANQRAGAHFFCDDHTLPNRGNSYFVYLREEADKAQIYKVVNDTWTLQAEEMVVVNEAQEYDLKVVYDPEYGVIRMFVDNEPIVEWTDPSPLKSGNSFSLRSAGSAVRFDDVEIFRSRGNQFGVTIGENEMIRFQDDNGHKSAFVETYSIDVADNWSASGSETYHIDWTPPVISVLNDGTNGNDVDTIYTPVISSYWISNDPHSGVSGYEVAIGTTVSAQDIMLWTNAGSMLSVNHFLQNPVVGQTYYTFLRSENAAGLVSELVSDGQKLLNPPPSTVGLSETEKSVILIYPQPASQTVTVISGIGTICLYESSGKLALTTKTEGKSQLDISSFAAGIYTIVFGSEGVFSTQKLIISR